MDGYERLFDNHYCLALHRNGDGRDEATMVHAIDGFCRGVHVYGHGLAMNTTMPRQLRSWPSMHEVLEQCWWNRQH